MLFKKLAAIRAIENQAREDELNLIEQAKQADQAEWELGLLADQKQIEQANQANKVELADLKQALRAGPEPVDQKLLLLAYRKKLKKFNRDRQSMRAVISERKLHLLAQQAVRVKQAALERENQLWWKQMWEEMLISLRVGIVTTPIMVVVLVSSKYLHTLDYILDNIPTSMLTDCDLPAENIPTNNIPTNNIPENSSVWNFEPTTNGIRCIALASFTVCAASIYIITKLI